MDFECTALKLKYIGTAYHGWQRQKNAVTVQQTLEEALSALLSKPVSVVGCGRTDAGVHAQVYAANFREKCSIPYDRLPLALNARLPQDIGVLDACPVSSDFHAVFSCKKKEYTYYICNSRLRDPFYVDRACFVPGKLDMDAMVKAAEYMKGTHDFKALRSVGTNVKTTVRTVYDFEITRTGDIIKARISANGFLYNMARAMVGTALYAAQGKIRPEDIENIINSGERCLAGPTMPPGGLYMTGVEYEEEPVRSMMNGRG
ncbi:MAG: tRNA pseudouridine(38-40) synthase TruA [Oscillospiraceae bacterium]|nr:tRNA pseudouridine(38-40) synthase TruA [Oscillospiraceae bacterium]